MAQGLCSAAGFPCPGWERIPVLLGAGAGGSFRSASEALALLTSTPAPALKMLRGWELWLMLSRVFLVFSTVEKSGAVQKG